MEDCTECGEPLDTEEDDRRHPECRLALAIFGPAGDGKREGLYHV